MDTNAEPGQNKQKILWVEDDNFLNDLIATKLSKLHYQLTLAKSAEETYSKIASDRPNVIILDMVLPGEDGFQILEKLKANPEWKDIPVIVFSNLFQRSDIDKAKALGAVKYFIKATLSIDKMVKEIEQTLKELSQIK